MHRHLRQYFFKIYVPLLIVLVAVVLALAYSAFQQLGLMASGIAFAHFVQKQRLEELALFHRLFADFNARYDRLNNLLQDMLEDSRHLTRADQATLLDYFNLCGEEFFFYSQGLVPRSVWKAWCLGMLEHLDDSRVAELWEKEESRGSYYGLTRTGIARGADRDSCVGSESSRVRLAA